ncbi:MAG: uroporphyrinogen decarboxylase family protein [Limnochordia bacterium]|jgi:uroporphyrinogen decarboxylase
MANHAESYSYPTLSRDEVKAALGFHGPPRPPLAMSLWHNAETVAGRVEEWQTIAAMYPDDCVNSFMAVDYWRAPADDPTYRWAFGNKEKPVDLPIDACPIISDWDELTAFLAEFPNPRRASATDHLARARAENPDRYILVNWGHYFHQRLAYLRGIEPLLFDFYDHPNELRRVMRALLDLYAVWATRAAQAGADGIWAGDDLGTQLSLFMRPETFRELYKPFYADLADILHGAGLDFWLHTCGNITAVLPDLIEVGVDAVHPIQVGTMDDAYVAEQYGGKIAFWLGMDVQNVIPFGTPEQIREHVANRIRIFYRPEGGLILAAGNAILRDTPLENVCAYAEALRAPIAK